MCVLQIGVIGDIGGRTFVQAVRRAMRFCMSNNLAEAFNMIGSKQKRAFGGTQLFKIVYSRYLFIHSVIL